MGTTWKACQIHAPGPSSDALMQHPGRWTGDCNSPSEVPLGAGPEAVLEEAPPPLRTKRQFHLPRSLLVWGFSSGTPPSPHQGSLCPDSLPEDFECRSLQQPWPQRGFAWTEPPDGGSSLTQVPCLHPQPRALPLAPSPPWDSAACPDLVEAGLGGAIRPSLDPGVWKEERQEEEREEEEEDKEEGRDDLPPLY